MAKKIAGWALLVLGIIIIGYTLYSSYGIFTGETEPPMVFESSVAIEEGAGSQTGEGVQGQIEAQMQQAVQEQLKGMLPLESFFKLFNLIAWSILAFILIFGGAHISALGIKLVK